MAYTEQLNPAPGVTNSIAKVIAAASLRSLVHVIARLGRITEPNPGPLSAQALQDTAAGIEFRDYSTSRAFAPASQRRLHGLADAARWQLPR